MHYKLLYPLLLVLSIITFVISHPLPASTKVTATATVTVMNTRLNPNQASIEQLTAIKGINHHAAREIIEYRQYNNGFVHLDELLKIKGIGPATLRKIEPFLTL